MGKPVVRILAVADDSDGGFLEWTDKAQQNAFHMGEFLKVLGQTVWLGFNIEIIRAHQDPPLNGETPAAALARTGADAIGFRFDQPFQAKGKTQKLAEFDIVLFLPAARPPFEPDIAKRNAEVAAIIDFMESGGGFFATGDHDELGSSLPPFIPRVRSMRRWLSNANPPAPDGYGSGRIDTTHRGHNATYEFEDQSDDIAQEIALTWFGGIQRYPHPLLCSPAGAIHYLPDHMHEGICDEPADLTATFQYKGAATADYPDLNGQPLGPRVIATGQVYGGRTMTSFDGQHNETEATQSLEFGSIGAWDGHRVNRGRVVVDSTWHHFFNINLTGDKRLVGNPAVSPNDQRIFGFYLPDGQGGFTTAPHYEMIQWYYRNIIYWLIPAHRTKTLWWSALGELVAHTPRLKEELSFAVDKRFVGKLALDKLGLNDLKNFDRWRYFGQLAEDYLKQARGACSILIIRDILYKPKIPWWEWIQEEVDPWGPIQKRRPELDRYRQLRSLGLAPRLDVFLTAGLGLAAVLAASMRATLGEKPFSEQSVRILDKAWDETVVALDRSFQAHLAAGLESSTLLAKKLAPTGRKAT
ncbi:hypothetical protein PMI01_02915 [Caulobacter sp. AP07]|uniref:hypothetical protein n=1 Tax=Caulobacter sp. AP07 TaxID=1144304 RepID=UPI000271DEE4|nr:hypothetical protein [Caulobacter sp. AP07]EJL31106.1 hypothetical protein PMI01_02915 [Caulobacter sp. AP07]